MSLTTEKSAVNPVEPPPVTRKPPATSDPISAPPKGPRLGRWILLLLLIGGGFFAWRAFAPHPAGDAIPRGAGGGGGRMGGGDDANRPIPVVAGVATERDFPLYLDGLGTVQAYNSVTVRARVDGEIQQILFQEGQNVNKGDQLAQIDPRPYQSQYDQAAAKKAQDVAQLQNARVVLARDDLLIKTKVLDQQTDDSQKYMVDQLAALVNADQAAIDNAQTQLDYTHLFSPISGRAGIRLVDAGNLVHATDATGIVVINQVQPISVSFTLPQQQLGPVRDALLQKQKLQVTAVDRNNLTPLSTGELAVLDNQIDPTTATVKLKATFANQDLKLWPGQFVNVRLLLGVQKGAVCVPTPAVQRGPNGPFVYVIQPDSTVAMRSITPGADEDGWTLVTDGLKAGEQVVVDGQYRLRPDSKVTLTPAHGNRKAQAAATPDAAAQ